jgi:hypothetical protein
MVTPESHEPTAIITVSTIEAVGVGPCNSPGVAGAGLSGAAQAVPSKVETTRNKPTAATITQSPSPRSPSPRSTLPCLLSLPHVGFGSVFWRPWLGRVKFEQQTWPKQTNFFVKEPSFKRPYYEGRFRKPLFSPPPCDPPCWLIIALVGWPLSGASGSEGNRVARDIGGGLVPAGTENSWLPCHSRASA